MSDNARKHSSHPGHVAPVDESSTVRERNATDSARPRQDSGLGLRSEPATAPRSHSSTRPALGSLGDRLEQKVRLAAVLVQNLPSTDSRVRLLHIAIMRRDESLLDGVLAALNKPATGS